MLLAAGATLDEPRFRIVDSFFVEVLTATKELMEQDFEGSHHSNARIPQTQLATARVLFDRTDVGATMCQSARRWLEKPIVPPSEDMIHGHTAWIWSTCRKLRQSYDAHAADFVYQYHHGIHHIYWRYALSLGRPVIDPARQLRWLTDASCRRALLMDDFPDGEFAERFARATTEGDRDEMIRHAEALAGRALLQLGGFDVAEVRSIAARA